MDGVWAGIPVPSTIAAARKGAIFHATDSIPLRLCTLVSNVSQTATIVKRIIAYARDAIRDRDACQTGAIVERILAYARHAVRDRDAC